MYWNWSERIHVSKYDESHENSIPNKWIQQQQQNANETSQK